MQASLKKVSYWVCVIATLLSITTSVFALDEDGNFESQQEQDAYIAIELKKLAIEMNAQMPIPINEHSRMMSMMAIQKKMHVSIGLTNLGASDVDQDSVKQEAIENLSRAVCTSKAMRDLIDWGVEYVYTYTGNDGVFITRVIVNSYRC